MMGLLWTAAAIVATVLAVAVFAVVVHGVWVAGEHVKVRLAARLNVPYRRLDPPWIVWLKR